MHGGRRLDLFKRGADHPNYRHGKETLEAKKARHDASVQFRELWEMGRQIGMFEGRLVGRKPGDE